MPRTLTLHPLSLAIGASVIGGAFLLASQTLPPPQVVWPPPKALMLNVCDVYSPPVSVAGSGTYSILTVPGDRWLTITGASLLQYATFEWVETTSSGGVNQKGFTSVLTSPLNSPSACGGPVGWTFAPGSSVGLLNLSSGAQNLTGVSLIGFDSRN